MSQPSTTPTPAPLYLKTPLIYSSSISARLGCKVYLKLDLLQPSKSFKHRGLSLYAQHALATHGPSTHLVAASGGNAGLAVAVVARELGVRCTIFIPAAAKGVVPVLEQEGAKVVVGGIAYVDALREAEALVASEPEAVLIPAYDDPLLWLGHSSLVTELPSQLPPGSPEPSAIFCSVGGGGLLGGVITGANKLMWKDTQVVGLETSGGECFHLSMLQNPQFCPAEKRTPLPEGATVHRDEKTGVDLVTLSKITTRAASLGASSPAAGVVKMALERGGVRCVTVRDEMSMRAGLEFLEEHKILTELACSTTLVPAYSRALFDAILPPPSAGQDLSERVVVFVVCGGVKVSLKEVMGYERLVELERQEGRGAEAVIDGLEWRGRE